MITALMPENNLNLRRPFVTLAFWIALLAASAQAEEQTDFSVENFKAFLTAIEGSWKGQAVTTPVGPRPYDIRFRRTSNTLLEGHANPGEEATHYWTFFISDQVPALRFLSTFAGNRQPLLLIASAANINEWRFNASDPSYLEVRVKPQKQELMITIYIHSKLHVVIKLTRPEDEP